MKLTRTCSTLIAHPIRSSVRASPVQNKIAGFPSHRTKTRVVSAPAATSPVATATYSIEMANLFLISFSPIAKIILMCAVGAVCTRMGFLDAQGRKQLSLLVFHVFAPALLFIKLAAAISFESLIQWLPIVFLTWLGIVIGLAVANVLGRVMSFPKYLQPVAMAAISMANIGNLPLVIVASLASDPSSPFHGLVSQGIAYVSLAMFAQSTVFFSLGYTLMKKPERRVPTAVTVPPATTDPSTQPGAAAETRPLLMSVTSLDARDDTREPSSSKPPQMTALEIEPDTARPSTSTTGGGDAKQSNGTDRSAGSPASTSAPANSDDDIHVPGVWELLRSIKLKDVFTPPNRASFAAMIIGCIPFLKSLFFSADPTKLAPLEVVSSTISILADACVPAMMIVLGSILSNGPAQGGDLSVKNLVGIVAGKLVIVPLVGIAILLFLIKVCGFSPADPFFTLICLLNFSMPTAINLQTLAVLNGYAEMEVSTAMFWQYLASIVTLPFFIFLSLVITT